MSLRKFLIVAALFLQCLSSTSVWAFQNPGERHWAPLLIEMSSTFVYVGKEGRVDQDSSLLYVCRKLHLSRLHYILQGMNASDVIASNDWFDRQQPDVALQRLTNARGAAQLRLQVLLGAYYAFQPLPRSVSRDSCVTYLTQALDANTPAGEEPWKRLALTLLAKYYVEGSDLAKGKALFDQLAIACQKAHDTVAEARALFYRGFYMQFTKTSIPDRIASMQKAIQLYQQLGDMQGLINAHSDIGFMYMGIDQIPEAGEQFKTAIRLEQSIGFPYTHYTTDKLARVMLLTGEYGPPLNYALQSIRTAEATGDTLCLATFYDRLAVVYDDNERIEEEIEAARKAVDQYKIEGASDGRIWGVMNLYVIAMIAKGQQNEALQYLHQVAAQSAPKDPESRIYYGIAESDCFMALKQYPQAEAALQRIRPLIKQILVRPDFYRGLIDTRFGKLYFETHQYTKAKYFLTHSSDSTTISSLGYIMYRHQALATIDSAEGNYKSAFEHSLQYTHLLDSSMSASQRRTFEDLTIQYETDKKQKEIEAQQQHIRQLQQEDELRQSALQQARLIRNVTIAGILLLMSLVILIYRHYRQNRKIAEIETQKNEVITRKNGQLEELIEEKNWLLKEVHHRVKNNLHTIISLLESQALYLENDALKAMETSQHRIYAMSLLHQKIYQSEDIKTIDMGRYLPEFIEYLREGFGEPDNIIFRLDIDPIRLDDVQSIPVALIINEGVSNAIKYAFPDQRPGLVSIYLKEQAGFIHLTITDDGVGMPPLWNNTELNSLGIELIKGLSRELKGDLSFEVRHGTRIRVTFAPGALPQASTVSLS